MSSHPPKTPFNIDWNKAKLAKVSISLDGHATSLSLETSFLEALKAIAKVHNLPFARLVRLIDSERPTSINLSSALRLAVLSWYQNKT